MKSTTTAPAAVIALAEINDAAAALALACKVCEPAVVVLVGAAGDWRLEVVHDADCPAARSRHRRTAARGEGGFRSWEGTDRTARG